MHIRFFWLGSKKVCPIVSSQTTNGTLENVMIQSSCIIHYPPKTISATERRWTPGFVLRERSTKPSGRYSHYLPTWLLIGSHALTKNEKANRDQSYTFSIPLTKKYPPASNRQSLSLWLCSKHKSDFTITGRRPIYIQWVSFIKSLFWTKPSFPVLDLSLFSKE